MHHIKYQQVIAMVRKKNLRKTRKRKYKRKRTLRMRGGGKEDAVICCIVKKEDAYIDEWIRYHLKMGFSKIYVYDNTDAFDMKHFFDDKAYKGKIELIHYPGNNMQYVVYSDFVTNHSNKHTWVAFFDIDEFITLINPEPIASYLSRKCPSGALSMSWRLFGDNGITEYSPGNVVERFIMCEKNPDKHVKTLSRCADIDKVFNSHFASLKEGKIQRDSHGNNLGGSPFNENPTLHEIYINHYFGKSLGEFLEKRKRGRPDITNPRSEEEFRQYNKNEVEDTRARDFFLKKELDFNT